MAHDIFDNDGSVRLQISIEAMQGDTAPQMGPPSGAGGPGAGGPPPGGPPAGAPPQ